uniref:Protein kinase domain-containing protein n=1 Tax=Globodera rostochiensis TaxID=31243 RepID=A0A914GXZ6_GLORO
MFLIFLLEGVPLLRNANAIAPSGPSNFGTLTSHLLAEAEMSDKCPQNAAADKALAEEEEAEAEEADSFCWDSREGSMSPSPKHSASSSLSSSPTRQQIQRISAKRSVPSKLRQSVFNGTSPLHVAALFASAAKAAVIGTGTDSALTRDENVSRLFMNSDEVFKMWEENIRQVEDVQNTRGVRKNASLHERGGNARYRDTQILQRAQSTDVAALVAQCSSASISKSGSLKLSTGSMPSERLDVLAVQRQQRSASMQQHKASLAGEPKRRASTMGDRNGTFGGAGMELRKVALDNDYNLLKELSSGHFGTVQLTEHKQSRQKADFLHEYHLARFLSAHPNILDTFDGCFETDDESAFFFVQECAPGQISLKELLTIHPGGFSEQATKLIMLKVLAAVEFMHSEGLTHRNIRAESVLILDPNKLSRVKLIDLCLTKATGSTVRHQETVNSYSGPELCDKVPNESYAVATSVDIWATGILVAYCLKGKFPWQKATIMCKPFWEWDQWMKRKVPHLPKYWDMFSEKALKLFKHTLNPKAKERWGAREMRKLVEKERLLKTKGTAATHNAVYYPDVEECLTPAAGDVVEQQQKPQPKKSMIGQWLNHTLSAMSEISEQVVSARDDD